MLKRLVILPLLLFLMLPVAGGHEEYYGLRFFADGMSSRTSLQLCPEQGLSLSDSLRITCVLRPRQGLLFGNVLNLSGENGECLYCLIPANRQQPGLTLKYADQVCRQVLPLRSGVETRVSLTVNKKRRNAVLSVGGRTLTLPVDFSRSRKVHVNFGMPTGQYENHETAAVDIRDITVTMADGTLWQWLLRQHNDSVCYDETGRLAAVAHDGHWLLDDHVRMRRVYHWKGQGRSQEAFDPRNDRFYITDGHTMTSFDPATGQQHRRGITRGFRVMEYGNHLMCEPATGIPYSYHLNLRLLARYDTVAAAFSANSPAAGLSHHYHHARAFADSVTAYAFGGYGYFRYSNDLYRIDTRQGKVERVDYQPQIPPRNGAAACVVDGKLYLFGGFGNESGQQEMDCQYYYDLYCIDLRTRQARRLWTAPRPENDFIVTSQMYWHPADSSFYVGTSSPEGAIARVSMNRAEWSFVTTATDVDFHYQDCSFELYQSERLRRLFWVIDKHLHGETHEVSIYAVDLPLTDGQLRQTSVEVSRHTWTNVLLWLAGIGVLGVLCWMWLRRKSRLVPSPEQDLSPSIVPADVPSPSASPQSPPTASAISLLGRFTVTDASGADITGEFTPLLRDLLVILLLYSEPPLNGISKSHLDTLLWAGMDEKKAHANRHVNISRLRTMLRALDGIAIESDRMTCRVKLGQVRLDYHEALRALRHADDGKGIGNLTCCKPLLPDLSTEWLDSFKGDYSHRVISLLLPLSRRLLNEGDYLRAHELAELILQHDPFHEEGLVILCHSLCRQQQVGVAKSFYEKFCRNYQSAMGEPFDKSFSEICAN